MSAVNAGPRDWAVAASVILGMLAFLAMPRFLAVLSPGDSAVLVRARTESVSIELDAGAARTWYLRHAKFAIDNGTEASFSGQLEPAAGATVRAERLGSGDLYLLLDAGTAATAGRLISGDEQDTRTARRTIEVTIPAAAVEGHLLPYSGRAVLGEIVGPQTRFGAPILLSGSIQIVGRTLVEGQPYVAAEAEALAGDQIEVAARNGEVAPSHGFLRIDSEDGIFVASDASGLGVRTRRFGVEDAFVVRRSPWSALRHDQFALFTSLAIPMLLGVIPIVQAMRDRRLVQGSDGSPGPPVTPAL